MDGGMSSCPIPHPGGWSMPLAGHFFLISLMTGHTTGSCSLPRTGSRTRGPSYIWTLLMEGRKDDAARAMLEAELTMPPPEAAGEAPEDDMSSMVAAMRAMPGVS